MNKRIVSFPHMGNYSVAAKPLAQLFGDEALIPPAITKHTLEIGTKYSPEAACIPFKYSLGNFIEALEQGANVIVQAGGGCRMGYYGEVQKAILSKLGYEFEFVKLTNEHSLIQIARYVKHLHPHLSYITIFKRLWFAYEKALTVEQIEDFIRKNVGFETQKGSFKTTFERFLSDLDSASSISQVQDVRHAYLDTFASLDIIKPAQPLRVGVVGEIYVVMEPFSNFFIETEMAKYGIEVYRFISITGVLKHGMSYNKHITHLLKDAAPYIHHNLGAHGTESVALAHQLAKQGFHGLLHVKPFGCMPEINAMPALQHISRDHHFPILYFSFDSLTSEIGVKTRLEAFYDMLVMKEANCGFTN